MKIIKLGGKCLCMECDETNSSKVFKKDIKRILIRDNQIHEDFIQLCPEHFQKLKELMNES